MSDEQLPGPGGAPARKGRRAGRGLDDKSPYYILAAAPAADECPRVLKQGDTFAVFDHYGDIKQTGLGEEGLYHEGTRFLSYLVLGLGEGRPLFLSSTVREDNDRLAVDLTNPDVPRDGRVAVPRGTLHVAREKLLWQGVCYEQIRVRNYGLATIDVTLRLHFEADFVDIFEVRGTRRSRRGEYLESVIEPDRVTLGYRGLDEVERRTQLVFSPTPGSLEEAEARYDFALKPQDEAAFEISVVCERGEPPPLLSYSEARFTAAEALVQMRLGSCHIHTTNAQFNEFLRRAAADLAMMTTETDAGPYPYAGVPWFSTPFGRDGILTALECLWIEPRLARGVLGFLAGTQATTVDPARDAEPGKILHEMRRGEMAALGEIPFGRYYGSVDATPLFVMLAGAYFDRTGEHSFIESIWPNIEAALHWMETYGDPDGDGFIEYQRHSPTGLVQQGWKDSHDSVFHADGSAAPAPIALCEVQGYAYAARRAAAALAATLGRTEQAEQWGWQAETLRRQFEAAFWCEELGTYALALDGKKRPCRVRTSNPGHCLAMGIATPERARRVAATLLAPDSFSGWGVRTLAAGEARYNPMSYHNGSVWPHDNALIAWGLARYGLQGEALRILEGLFQATLFLDLHRLPELFCGFTRRLGEGPTLYPVACAPQAWSAGAVFLLLQACLGIEVRTAERRLSFLYPRLPELLPQLHITNLRVGEATLDLLLLRHGNDVGVNVLRRDDGVEITLRK